MSNRDLLAWKVVDLVMGTPTARDDETPYGYVMVDCRQWKRIEDAAKACFAPPSESPSSSTQVSPDNKGGGQ